MTVGPWRAIHLEHYTSRISDVRIDQDVKEDLSASVSVTVQCVASFLVIHARPSPCRAAFSFASTPRFLVVFSYVLIQISFSVPLRTEGDPAGSLQVVLKSPKGEVVKSAEADKSGKVSWEFKKGELDLW